MKITLIGMGSGWPGSLNVQEHSDPRGEKPTP